MKGMGVCLKGIEDICALEVKELIGKTAEIKESAIFFEAELEELARFSCMSQSSTRVIALLGEFKAQKDINKLLETIEKSVKKIDFSRFLEGHTFKVISKARGEDFTGQDISPSVGDFILEKTKTTVSMDPEVYVILYIIGKQGYIGIDMSGFDLSKRDYRVFSHPDTLNATMAYALTRMVDYKKMIDPFCGSGMIPIEAAIHKKHCSPHHFKKEKFSFNKWLKVNLDTKDGKVPDIRASDQVMRFVSATKHNAKLAGVDKDISVNRMDIEWFDTKFTKGELDAIITHPPSSSKIVDRKDIDKLMKEFFYQSEFVLKKKGKIVLCSRDLIEPGKDFSLVSRREAWQGMQQLNISIFEKI